MKNHRSATTPKDLLTDLKSLVAEAETMMASSVSEHSSDAIGQLRARFESAQDRFSELYDGAKKKVVEGAKYTDTTIRENPYRALAIAAGLGLLVGLIAGRRSR